MERKNLVLLPDTIYIKKMKKNQNIVTMSEEYNIPQNTIDTWVYKTQKGQDVLVDRRKQNGGRPKKDENNIDYKERYEILKKYQAFLKAQREKR